MESDTLPEILDRIEEIIAANGNITQSTKDRLILMALAAIGRDLCTIRNDQPTFKEELKELRRYNILMWVRDNPKLAVTIAVIFYITSAFFKTLVASYLGIPEGLIP